MKIFPDKKILIRRFKALLVIGTLIVLFVTGTNWWGARLKRDAIAQLRADGRPASLREFIQPLPPEDENFAMIPVLKRAREECLEKEERLQHSIAGFNLPAGPASASLQQMGIEPGTEARFSREGRQNLDFWKERMGLAGSAAECLNAYDHHNHEVITELRDGVNRPELATSILEWLAKRDPSLSGGSFEYWMALVKAASGFGFRAELALEADRPDISCESLIIAIRLRELIATDYRTMPMAYRPTLARVFEDGKLTHQQLLSIRERLSALTPIQNAKRSLDLQNFATFARFDQLRDQDRSRLMKEWTTMTPVAKWKRWVPATIVTLLPDGWFDACAAMHCRAGLSFRNQIDRASTLSLGYQISTLRMKGRDDLNSKWPYWFFPANNPVSSVYISACRSEVAIRQAILACNLESFRLDHGNYPTDLTELQSSSIIDPMSAEPFKYRLAEKGYILYSIGPNNKDDGGNRSTKLKSEWSDPDWIW